MKRNILTIISAVMAILALCSILFVYGCVKSGDEAPTVGKIELKTEEYTHLEDVTIGKVDLSTKPVTEPATEAPDDGITEEPTVLDGTLVDAD